MEEAFRAETIRLEVDVFCTNVLRKAKENQKKRPKNRPKENMVAICEKSRTSTNTHAILSDASVFGNDMAFFAKTSTLSARPTRICTLEAVVHGSPSARVQAVDGSNC